MSDVSPDVAITESALRRRRARVAMRCRNTADIIGGVLWPTRKVAGFFKKKGHPQHNGRILRRWSCASFVIDLTSAIALTVATAVFTKQPSLWPSWFVALAIWYSVSRANEIVTAFWADALDRIKRSRQRSDVPPVLRVQMAARSYAGLLVNFATLYCFVPIANGFDKPFNSYFDSLYFSGVTLATLGYGDIAPRHWFFRMCSVYEVFSGLLLVAISIAVYIGATQESAKK